MSLRSRRRGARQRVIPKPPLGSSVNWDLPITEDLQSCYLFNEGSGNTVTDLSENESNGTLRHWASGWQNGFVSPNGWQADGSLLFNGSEYDHILCGNPTALKQVNEITIATKFKPSAGFDSDNWGLITKHQSAFDADTSWCVRSASPLNKISFSSFGTYGDLCRGFVNGSLDKELDSYYVNCNTIFSPGSWYSFASTAHGNSFGDNSLNICIGALQYQAPDSPIYLWNGYIQYMYVWSRVLTASEIASIHRNPWNFITRGT